MTGLDSREFERDGVWVTHASPAVLDERPPLVFVHGGGHASWCWEHLLPFFAQEGWECLALDWFNHGRSKATEPDVFLRRRLADVAEEIGVAAGVVGRPPVLVGHSMGGAACLSYAAASEVAGMVLIATVVPAGLGAPSVDIPVDPDRLFGPVPFEMARQMFFTSMDEPTARHYAARLGPESPQTVLDAARWRVEVDLDAIDADALVFAGERDTLCPPGVVELLARAIDAEYVLVPDRGHDDLILLDGCWEQVAATTRTWLETRFAADQE